ncbi:MAG: CotH kinase family protein [Bryobacterales bacterium]|nr:CotH kinase family protein [Bryobacterales bacterium]
MKSPACPIVAFVLASALSSVPQQARAQTLDTFFDTNFLHEIHLEIAPEDWQAIHERYLDDTYYRCTFTWKDVTLAGAGIKSRGSQSRSPIKPSIGLDFGKFAPGQRFLGLKSLVLRNLNQDATMMRERLAEQVFQRMGLPYSREAHARLYVNGEYAGVYLVVEPYDAHYLQSRFGEDGGWLYEFNNPDPPFLFDPLTPEREADILSMFEPKTRADAPDAPGLLAMIRFVNESTDEEFAAGIDSYLDVSDFLAHAATEQVLSQWDGLIGVNGMNNFYFYRFQTTGRGVFLVWDQDMAFVDVWSPIWTRVDQNILIRRLLSFPEWNRLYLDMLANANHVISRDDWLAAEIDRIYYQIRDAAYEDSYRLCRGDGGIVLCSLDQFEHDIDSLRDFARYRPVSITQDLAASGYPDAGTLSLPPGSIVDADTGASVLSPGTTAFVEFLLNDPVRVDVFLNNQPMAVTAIQPEGITFQIPVTGITYGPQPLMLLVDGNRTNSVMIGIRPKE